MASATLPRNGQSHPFDHVIGIDTHRDFHVAVALAPNGGKLGQLTFQTSREGYEQLMIWSEQFGVRPVFAMEGTGSYGAGLCAELLDAAYDMIEVNRPDRAARRRHGKDDPVDAEAAARGFLAGFSNRWSYQGAESGGISSGHRTGDVA